MFNKGMVRGARAGFGEMAGLGCLGTGALVTPRVTCPRPGLGMCMAYTASSRGIVPFFPNHLGIVVQHERWSPFSFSHQVTSKEMEHPQGQIFSHTEVPDF